MRRNFLAVLSFLVSCLIVSTTAHAAMIDHPVVRLQSLDKVTARTMTFEVRVGSTVKFGSIFIKVQACRKAEPTDAPESASFLQVWEVTPAEESRWIFSGWMFASSPALSPMDHPIYDVWVLDCLERKSSDPVPVEAAAPVVDEAVPKNDSEITDGTALPGEGVVTGPAAEPPPDTAPKPVVQMPEGYVVPGTIPRVTDEPIPDAADEIDFNDRSDAPLEEDMIQPEIESPEAETPASDTRDYIEQVD